MEQNKRGAPTKYKPEYAEEARKFCLLKGATDEELAEYFEVAESTIKEWYKKHPEFSASVRAGKAGADMNVAEGLYKRATGYEYSSEKIVTISVGDGCSEVQRVPITAVVLPDPGAALNWLKNRQPDSWRDKLEIDLPPKIKLTMNLDGAAKPTQDL